MTINSRRMALAGPGSTKSSGSGLNGSKARNQSVPPSSMVSVHVARGAQAQRQTPLPAGLSVQPVSGTSSRPETTTSNRPGVVRPR